MVPHNRDCVKGNRAPRQQALDILIHFLREQDTRQVASTTQLLPRETTTKTARANLLRLMFMHVNACSRRTTCPCCPRDSWRAAFSPQGWPLTGLSSGCLARRTRGRQSELGNSGDKQAILEGFRQKGDDLDISRHGTGRRSHLAVPRGRYRFGAPGANRCCGQEKPMCFRAEHRVKLMLCCAQAQILKNLTAGR